MEQTIIYAVGISSQNNCIAGYVHSDEQRESKLYDGLINTYFFFFYFCFS